MSILNEHARPCNAPHLEPVPHEQALGMMARIIDAPALHLADSIERGDKYTPAAITDVIERHLHHYFEGSSDPSLEDKPFRERAQLAARRTFGKLVKAGDSAEIAAKVRVMVEDTAREEMHDRECCNVGVWDALDKGMDDLDFHAPVYLLALNAHLTLDRIAKGEPRDFLSEFLGRNRPLFDAIFSAADKAIEGWEPAKGRDTLSDFMKFVGDKHGVNLNAYGKHDAGAVNKIINEAITGRNVLEWYLPALLVARDDLSNKELRYPEGERYRSMTKIAATGYYIPRLDPAWEIGEPWLLNLGLRWTLDIKEAAPCR